MYNPKVVVDPELHDWLKLEAKRNKRTIQGQLEFCLELSKQEIESKKSCNTKSQHVDIDLLKKAQ